MNSSRIASLLAVACLMTLTACSSDSAPSASVSATSASSSTTSAAAGPNGCPSAAPANGGTPDWEFGGDTGKIAVTGPTDSAAPRIDVTSPFSVSKTEVHTLQIGDGAVVPQSAAVLVCYLGVNGRDGKVFDSTYQRGDPTQFTLDGVVAGFQKSIVGQKVGSTVAVAVTPADGYPDGQPAVGIEKGDTLIFALKILQSAG